MNAEAQTFFRVRDRMVGRAENARKTSTLHPDVATRRRARIRLQAYNLAVYDLETVWDREGGAQRMLAQLQKESKVWVDKNFAPRPAHHPLLGIVEEIGELEEARTKDEVIDAVADATIFMADLCNEMKFDLATLYEEALDVLVRTAKRKPLAGSMGRLCHAFLKKQQGIRGTPQEHDFAMRASLVEILVSMLAVARAHEFYFLEAVQTTWDQVKDRVWRCQEPTCHTPLSDPKVHRCDQHRAVSLGVA